MAIDSSLPSPNGVDLNNVNFAYPGCDAFLRECSLHLPRGSRCLLIGANGAGKTTLLQVVAGKYMTPSKEDVYVLGRPPFFDLVRNLGCRGWVYVLRVGVWGWSRGVASPAATFPGAKRLRSLTSSSSELKALKLPAHTLALLL